MSTQRGCVSPSLVAIVCGRGLAARLVAQVLPGRDPGRFPEGRRREPLDRQPRPARARPGRPSWSTKRPSPFLWAVVAGADGSLFIGTGNDGRVFRVDPQGKGASFFDGAELEVHALAPAPDGGLYVGSSPDGKIYKVDRNGRRHDVLRSRREIHLGADRRRARATSTPPPARRASSTSITPDGKGARFYQTKATHATALAFDKRRQSPRRHRVAGPRAARRSAGQGVRAPRLAVPGNPHAAVRRQRACSTSRR